MISLRFLSSLRNISPYLKQSSLQVHTSVMLLDSKDSSSSSSSSDSDSDKEDQKINKFDEKTKTKTLKDAGETLKVSDTNERLNALLQKINKASEKEKFTDSNKKGEIVIEGLSNFISKTARPAKTIPKSNTTKKKSTDMDSRSTNQKTIHVAIKPKSIRFNHMSQEEKLKQKPHEHQIKQVAKDVAESLGGDTQKTELELLTKALNLKQKTPDTVSSIKEEEEKEKPADLGGLLRKMKVDSVHPEKQVRTPTDDSRLPKIQLKKPSVAESVLYAKSITRPKRYAKPERGELNVSFQAMGILKKISKDSKDELQLPTWNTMAKREMRLNVLTVPQNVFQELIQWTNEGKIWKFPIDNEQGMEEENNIHFSEHVFMEKHIKGWCPKRGPIRHFMELVCIGLSKNPYMTVEEKVGHITWYKNYFEDKKELLHELGVLDDKAAPVASTGKKQIEA